jgi:hypothetical protein
VGAWFRLQIEGIRRLAGIVSNASLWECMHDGSDQFMVIEVPFGGIDESDTISVTVSASMFPQLIQPIGRLGHLGGPVIVNSKIAD